MNASADAAKRFERLADAAKALSQSLDLAPYCLRAGTRATYSQ
jgi:hypothetical protein